MKENTLAERPQDIIDPEIVIETPDLETMDRGDSLAIWTGYREEFERLKLSIERVLESDPEIPATSKIARVNRLELRQIRIAVEKRRKELGDSYLRKTKAINGAAKELKDLIEPYEDKLQAVEDHAENVERERIVKLGKERLDQLSQYGGVADIPGIGFMPEDQFESLLEGAKLVHQAKIEAEKKAEAERIAKEKAEAEELERIQIENEKLKKEAAEKEAALAAERAKVEAERKEAELKAKAERDAIEAKAKGEREEAQLKAAVESARLQAIADKERKEREAIEAKAKGEREEAQLKAAVESARLQAIADKERKEREAIEAKAKDEREEKEAQEFAARKAMAEAELAPDREKLAAFAAVIRALEVPTITSKKGREIIAGKIEEFALWTEAASKNLRAK